MQSGTPCAPLVTLGGLVGLLNPAGPLELGQLGLANTALQRHCEAVGRPYESVLRTYFGGVLEFGRGVRTGKEHFSTAFGQYLVLHGDPKGAVAHFRALVDAGVRYFIVVGLDDANALRLFAEHVMAEVDGT